MEKHFWFWSFLITLHLKMNQLWTAFPPPKARDWLNSLTVFRFHGPLKCQHLWFPTEWLRVTGIHRVYNLLNFNYCFHFHKYLCGLLLGLFIFCWELAFLPCYLFPQPSHLSVSCSHLTKLIFGYKHVVYYMKHLINGYALHKQEAGNSEDLTLNLGN